MEKLVSWDGKAFKLDPGRNREWGPRTYGNPKQVEALLEQPRRKEIVRLVKALSAYYGAIGMHKICKACFAEDPAIIAHTHGNCCSPCGLLGETSCVSKPLACAAWMCHYSQTLFPYAWQLINKVQTELWNAKIFTGCFLPGRQEEQERHKRLSFKQKWVLASISRVLEREVINSVVNQQT